MLSCEWHREPEDVCTWEVEMQDASVTTQVKGRLKERLSFWREELRAPAVILDAIELGYVLPL